VSALPPPNTKQPLFQKGSLEIRRCKYGMMLYSTVDAYIGKGLQLYGEYSEDGVRFFARILKPGHTVVDVGANIGAHTVYFAGAVGLSGHVIAFEPLSSNFQLLAANAALNELSNIELRHAAVGGEAGNVEVPRVNVAAPGNQGAFSLLDRPVSEGRMEWIEQFTIDDLDLTHRHLIKADVEGMEIDIVAGATATMKRCRPMLYVENNREDKSSELIEALLSRDYACFWYLTRYFNPDNFFGNHENAFPDMFEQNMVAVPKIVAGMIDGLEPVASPEDWPLHRKSGH
jgi:FkbM family methyltransferase